MSSATTTAVALGAAAGIAYLTRPPSQIPVDHNVRSWWAPVRADIARTWPPATNASQAASAELKRFVSQYGTARIAAAGDDLPQVPLGELVAHGRVWRDFLDRHFPAAGGGSAPPPERSWWDELRPSWLGGGVVNQVAETDVAAASSFTVGRQFRNVLAGIETRAAARGGATVELAQVAYYQRILGLLAPAIDEGQDAFVPTDDRGYWDFFEARWDNATGAVADAGGAVAGVVGKVAGSVAGGLFGAVGQWLVIGGVAYYAWKRWPT